MLVFNRRLLTGVAALAMTLSVPAFAQDAAPAAQAPAAAAPAAPAAPEATAPAPTSEAAPAASTDDKAAKHKHKASTSTSTTRRVQKLPPRRTLPATDRSWDWLWKRGRKRPLFLCVLSGWRYDGGY